MNSNPLITAHNAPLHVKLPKMITITHPYHALHGQQFEVVRVLKGKKPLIEIRLPSKSTARLPIDYTDYGETQTMLAAGNDEPHLLSIDGLLRAVKLVDEIKRKKPSKANSKVGMK